MQNQPVINQQPGYAPQQANPVQQFQMQPTITTQPGAFVQPAPGAVWMPLPPAIQGVPTGLEYLTYLDMIMVHQIKELIEIVTDWETKNKYVLKNANGEQCYYAFEESGCCERQCCGPNRGFVMHVVDNFKREVLTIKREFKCCGGGCYGCFACVGCCQQECVVETPSMGVLGIIRQRCGFMSSNYDVCDGDGNVIFQIDGPCCCMLCGCQDKEFPIKTANNGTVVGAITKKWGGCFREAFTDADTFAVNFPGDLDVKLKGVLLGATFLIDFMEFEQQSQNRNNGGVTVDC
ncbi:CRE-SCRM-1 protein [Caenorhabditis remanei]|uniref:Phospholipid scramblase n=2 Tax=Caenorhabditis TaxID=6237 RepID=E3NJS4_CAERE|nr:CRE-SCRM-1 protein [Caenorhabditis remanei]